MPQQRLKGEYEGTEISREEEKIISKKCNKSHFEYCKKCKIMGYSRIGECL